MSVYYVNWLRIEGGSVPDRQSAYNNAITNIPNDQLIFYNTVSVQLKNPEGVIAGCVYKVIPLTTINASCNTIQGVDSCWNTLSSEITAWLNTDDNNLVLHDSVTPGKNANIYYNPFTVSQSSVIIYDSSFSSTYRKFDIILIDSTAIPEIATIAGVYTGPTIPVGNAIDTNYLQLNVIYTDGNRGILRSGYIGWTEPKEGDGDYIIRNTGNNVVHIEYPATNPKFKTTVNITGTKKIESISAVYDGPGVAIGQSVSRRYLIVSAHFSDGSTSVISEWQFYPNDILTDSKKITIYYKGLSTDVEIETYEITSARLMAYYNGPAVEVGKQFQTRYCLFKVHYSASTQENNHTENLTIDDVTLTSTIITKEGVNNITVSFNSRSGPITTTMCVIGVIPEKVLNFIDAQYTGPEIYKGKTYSLEKVIVRAHYSDGSVVNVNHFSVGSNQVNNIGPNEFYCYYRDKDIEKSAPFTVIGLAPEDTTENNHYEISIQNHYPTATRNNSRYRGPAESEKINSFSYLLYKNIVSLYSKFTDIENEFLSLVNEIEGEDNLKDNILNVSTEISSFVNGWMEDSRFRNYTGGNL